MSLAKHLPPGCAVRRATRQDALHVGNLLRPVDRAEMEALEGRPAGDMLVDRVTSPGLAMPRVLTIRMEPAVLYGVVACQGLPGEATPWLATVETLTLDDLTEVMWMSRLQIDVWQYRWPTLQAVCDTRNLFHRQWLEWLGFVARGHLESFGAAHLPFDLYVRGKRR